MELRIYTNKLNKDRFVIDWKDGYDLIIDTLDQNSFKVEFRRDHFIYRKVLVSFYSVKSLNEVIMDAGWSAYQYCADRPERYTPSWISFRKDMNSVIEQLEFRKKYCKS